MSESTKSPEAEPKSSAAFTALMEQWVGGWQANSDEMYRAGWTAGALEDAYQLGRAEARERIARLEEALCQIAEWGDCMTAGCNLDNPLCEAMFARAALGQGAEGAAEGREA